MQSPQAFWPYIKLQLNCWNNHLRQWPLITLILLLTQLVYGLWIYSCYNNEQIFFFFFFWLFRAAPMAYGSSQARGQIRAAAANLHDSHRNASICNLHHSSWQCWILNPLRETRDWFCFLMDTSWVCYHWSKTGPPRNFFLILILNQKKKLLTPFVHWRWK